MGCLKNMMYQIGCLLVALVLAVGAFIYREQVVALYHRLRGTPPAAEVVYARPTPTDRRDALDALERLSERGGPAFVDLTPGQVAALIEEAVGSGGARGLDSIAVGLMEDELRVRGSLDLSRVPREVLGPLRGVIAQREPVIIGGPLDGDSAGRLYLTVNTLRVSDFPFPRSTIARLLREIRAPGLEGNRIPLPSMRGVGDVRVSADAVRVYRRSPR